jgi:hypothetical protein
MNSIEQELRRIDYLYISCDLVSSHLINSLFIKLISFKDMNFVSLLFYSGLEEIKALFVKQKRPDFYEDFIAITQDLIDTNRLLFVKTKYISNESEAIVILNNKFKNIFITNDESLINLFKDYYDKDKVLIKEPALFMTYNNNKLFAVNYFDLKNTFYSKPIFDYRYKHEPTISSEVLVFKVPDTISKVYQNNKIIVLKEKVGSGSYANIYKITDSQVVKVYNKIMIRRFDFVKVKKMLSYNKFDNLVAWPIKIITDDQKRFIGYTMKYYQGYTFAQLLKSNVVYFNVLNNNHKRLFILKVIKSYLSAVLELHEQNVLLADVSAKNFIIRPNGEIALIDTDSFQFGNFISQMETKQYLSPENKSKSKSNYFRSFGSESYSIGQLITLMIMGVNFNNVPYNYFSQKIDTIVASAYPLTYGKKEEIWHFIINHCDSIYRDISDYRLSTPRYLEISKMYLQAYKNADQLIN